MLCAAAPAPTGSPRRRTTPTILRRVRVDQYTPIGPFYTFARTDFMQSGYRHTASNSGRAERRPHAHRRGMGTARAAVRRMAVPVPTVFGSVSLWGPPFAGLGGGGKLGPFGADQAGGGEAGRNVDPYGRQQPPPYYDGRNAPYRSRGPRDDRMCVRGIVLPIVVRPPDGASTVAAPIGRPITVAVGRTSNLRFVVRVRGHFPPAAFLAHRHVDEAASGSECPFATSVTSTGR